MSESTQWYKEFFGKLYGRVLARQFPSQRNHRQARLIKRLLGLKKGDRVLDCPCGMGRLTVPLGQLGLHMTGMDLSAPYVQNGRQAAKGKKQAIRFLRGDMRRLPFDGEFDAVINWFTSFGYFDNAGNLATARAALRALKPGGRFLIEMINKSWLLSNLQTSHDETIGGVRIVSRTRWDGRTSRTRSIWTMSRGRTRRTFRFSTRLYTGDEIRSLLRTAGFTEIRLWGHTPRGVQRFTRHSRRLIVIARRPMR